MEIVDTTKFAVGIVLALIGVTMLFISRGSRGFGQKRQAGALSLIGGLVMLALGTGLWRF